MKLKLILQYTCGANHKTQFTHVVDTDTHPKATTLKEGDEFTMGKFGTLPRTEFFDSEIHTFSYDREFDHNLLEVISITRITSRAKVGSRW